MTLLGMLYHHVYVNALSTSVASTHDYCPLCDLYLGVSLVVAGGARTSHHQLEPNLTDYLGKFCTGYNPCTLRG